MSNLCLCQLTSPHIKLEVNLSLLTVADGLNIVYNIQLTEVHICPLTYLEDIYISVFFCYAVNASLLYILAYTCLLGKLCSTLGIIKFISIVSFVLSSYSKI